MPRSPADELENDTRDEGEKKGLGRKLLGLFVETDGAAPAESDDPAAEIERLAKQVAVTSPGPVASGPAPVPVTPAAPVSKERPAAPASYKSPDFAGILKAAGMPDDERDRLAKAEELLRNLPAETPVALKKQIVEGTLRAFGIPPEKIVAAAKRAVDAYDQYTRIGQDELVQRQQSAEKRLTELNAEIERLRGQLSERRAMQAALEHDVRTRQDELRTVLGFFAPGGPA